MSIDNIYKMVTDQIIDRINRTGLLPWAQPWKVSAAAAGTMPRNITGHEYRGVNVMLLSGIVEDTGCNIFASLKQVNAAGGWVKQGVHGHQVIFWKWINVTGKDNEEKKIPLLRYYTVFNLSDTTLSDKWKKITPPAPTFTEVKGREMIDNWKEKPEIKNQGNRAFYHPAGDYIQLPAAGQFKSAAGYFATMAHECCHATGHAKRLARPGVMSPNFFGSHDYSFEELVAEIGAAYLCGRAGIVDQVIDNAAAYVKGWSDKLKDNTKWIVQAAAQAEKSARYILNEKTDYKKETTAPVSGGKE
jgi:antirestriction protein ArdC